ncbi:MAG: hypothetical protein KUG73_13670 [Pseudomonadales bacterium]|nr:hypothetical protein [Pseudomonadales bacterium]
MLYRPSHTIRQSVINLTLHLMIITCFLGFGEGSTVLAEQSPVEIAETPSIKYFYKKVTMSGEEMRLKSEAIAKSLAIAVVKKARTEITGPLIYVYRDLDKMAPSSITAKIGFEVKNNARQSGRYRFETLKPFRYISFHSVRKKDTKSSDSKSEWNKLYALAYKKGLPLSGESRTVIKLVEDNTALDIELQLGVN